jgi:hypothetical protein
MRTAKVIINPVMLSIISNIAMQKIAIYNWSIASLNIFLKGISLIIIIANKITNANNLKELRIIYIYILL